MANAKQLPSGSWRVQVYAGKDAQGKNRRVISQLEKMSDEDIKAVLAFINSLNDIEKLFSTNRETGE